MACAASSAWAFVRLRMASRWYVIHVYSGFEKKVATAIREQAEQKGLGDQFEEILVPTEEVVEVRRGAKVNAERKFFPGHVLVKMDLEGRDLAPRAGNSGKGERLPRRWAARRRRSARPRRRASCTRSRKASSGRSRRSPSRSASRCGFATGRSPRSTARSRKSTRKRQGSRSRCRSSAARRRSNSNTPRLRKGLSPGPFEIPMA